MIRGTYFYQSIVIWENILQLCVVVREPFVRCCESVVRHRLVTEDACFWHLERSNYEAPLYINIIWECITDFTSSSTFFGISILSLSSHSIPNLRNFLTFSGSQYLKSQWSKGGRKSSVSTCFLFFHPPERVIIVCMLWTSCDIWYFGSNCSKNLKVSTVVIYNDLSALCLPDLFKLLFIVTTKPYNHHVNVEYYSIRGKKFLTRKAFFLIEYLKYTVNPRFNGLIIREPWSCFRHLFGNVAS